MKRKNIIWVFGDQHRAQAMSCNGDPNVSTPNMDSMGVQGVHFKNAVASSPWCCPFRGSLLTGRYAHECVYKTPMALDPAEPTVVDALKSGGYRTRYVGKWHLAGSNASGHQVSRERRGRFDSWIGYENNNNQYNTHIHGHTLDGSEIAEQRLPGYETDSLTDIFINELRDEAQKREAGDGTPFFAVLSVQPPHSPYLSTPETMRHHRPGNVKLRPNVPPVAELEEQSRRDLAGYYAQIENLDDNLGRVRSALRELGMDKDTILFFFSDHGDMHGSHGYREKSMPWEESIRIPFFITGDLLTRTGRLDSVINVVDIAPTTLGLAGLPVPERMRGFDYSAYLDPGTRGPLEGEPESAFLQHCVRKRHPNTFDREWRGVVTRDGWKYVCIPHAPLMMHNLNEDPYELHNLVFKERYSAERLRLHNLLQEWMVAVGDTEFPLPDL